MAAANTNLLRKGTNNFSTTLSGAMGASDTTISLTSTTNLPTDTAITLVIDRVSSNGTLTPNLREYVLGVVSGTTLINVLRGQGNSTAQSHATGAVVEAVWTAEDWNDHITSHKEDHVDLGYHLGLHDSNGKMWVDQNAVTNSVNNILIGNAATGQSPTITVEGTDTNISLALTAKGTGSVVLPNGTVTFANLLSTIFSGQVQSYSNNAGIGSYLNYINLGGIKVCYGITGSFGITNGSNQFTLNLPTFFTNIQSTTANTVGMAGSANAFIAITATPGNNPTTIPFYVTSTGATSTQVYFLIIGS